MNKIYRRNLKTQSSEFNTFFILPSTETLRQLYLDFRLISLKNRKARDNRNSLWHFFISWRAVIHGGPLLYKYALKILPPFIFTSYSFYRHAYRHS